jgi:putative transposase
MQIKGLHKNIYKLSSYALSQEKFEIHRKKYEKPVKLWEQLKSEGASDKGCQLACGISKATYHRYKTHLKNLSLAILPPSKRPLKLNKPRWGEAELQLVLRIRREDPTYGKAKITVILKRDHDLQISESTTGRILKHLMNRGLIQKSISAPHKKRKRHFKGHAQPWVYGMKSLKPGQMIQIDHMSVSKNSFSFKHFQAWDPTSKFIHAGLYSNAKSRSAKKFLLEFIQKSPFKIESIQVDGGSEFMKDFEETCAEMGVQLFVLPPKRPQWNGGVERGNRIFREEFYSRKDIYGDSLHALRFDLAKSLHKYNTYRPHFNLKGLTPMQYLHDSYPRAA